MDENKDTLAAVLVETPSNPKLKITDISTVTAMCRATAADVCVIVDSTWATPALTRCVW